MTNYMNTRLNHRVVFFLLPIWVLVSSSLYAQTKREPNLFQILDGNRDGALDPFEAVDVLLQLESESGEKLTAKSLQKLSAERESEAREEFESFLEEMDENGDGKIQLNEVDAEMRSFAEQFDQNEDGVITVDEVLDSNVMEDGFMSAEDINETVDEIFDFMDANGDGVLVESESNEDFSWSQLSEGDSDSNGQVTKKELHSFLASDNQPAGFEVKGDVATMVGVINAGTPARVLRLAFEYPTVRTIVMKNVPGSMDDEANLRASRYVRRFGFTTIIRSDGSVASGGTDFFLAGVKRIVEPGGKLGIHSWGGPGVQGKDVPRDNPQHQMYLDYYDEMGIPGEFYWRTLEAAPVNDIHWMTEEEIKKFNVRTVKKLDQEPTIRTRQDEDDEQSEPDNVESLAGEARMMMALLDLNGDGKLQAAELEGDAKSMLRGVDTNGDGVITAAELSQVSDEPMDDVHSSLAKVDTFRVPSRVVDLPDGIHPGINRHFRKYTNVLAPNNKPIHFLAMDGWSDERILRVRKVMEHFLQSVPDRKWGEKKSLANAMADNHATMVLLNHSRDMDRVLPAIEGTNLQLQDLRANESPFEGEEDYMKHETRDAAYEEVFHLIHGSGLLFAMKGYDREIRRLAKEATESDLWNYDEPNMPGNHFEYIICVYDNYLDLWETAPTLMEGRRIGKQKKNQSFNGEYKAENRDSTRVSDPKGFEMIEKFNSNHILYTAELPAEFKGTFSIASDGGTRHSNKSKHLLNVTLRGQNPSALTGNQLNNRLVGNQGDNVLMGAGGDDSLFGGLGNDTAKYRGPRSQYIIRRQGNLIEVHDSMVDRDGYDVLTEIETLTFQDRSIDASTIQSP